MDVSCSFGGRTDSRTPLWKKIEKKAAARDAIKAAALRIERIASLHRQRARECKWEMRWRRRPSSPAEQIIADVCQKHDLTRAILLSRRRRKYLMPARREMCWRLCFEAGMTTTQIGRKIGRDHTTVIHSMRQYMLNDQTAPEAGL